MIRYLWAIPALLISLTMRPGIRYGGTSFRWAILRACILERDGYKCRECDRPARYGETWVEVHHRRPIRAGGNHRPWNLISLCKQCHDHIHEGTRR